MQILNILPISMMADEQRKTSKESRIAEGFGQLDLFGIATIVVSSVAQKVLQFLW